MNRTKVTRTFAQMAISTGVAGVMGATFALVGGVGPSGVALADREDRGERRVETRPGNGCGDQNHEHTGAPGNPSSRDACQSMTRTSTRSTHTGTTRTGTTTGSTTSTGTTTTGTKTTTTGSTTVTSTSTRNDDDEDDREGGRGRGRVGQGGNDDGDRDGRGGRGRGERDDDSKEGDSE